MERLWVPLVPAVMAGLVSMLPCEARAFLVLEDGAVHRTSDFPQEDSFTVQDSPSGESTRLIVDTEPFGIWGATVRGHSILDGERYVDGVALYDQAQATLTEVGGVTLRGSSYARVSGPTSSGTSYNWVYDNATLIWESGARSIDVSGHGSLGLIAGGFVEFAFGRDQATIVLDGPRGINSLRLFDTSVLYLMHGSVGGDELSRLEGQSRVEMYGGAITSRIEVAGDARLEIFGGTITDHNVLNTALVAEDNGFIRIHGSDFTVNGVPVGFGPISATSGQLGGTTLSGETFQYIVFSQAGGGTIQLVPEPQLGALLLTGVAVLGLWRRTAAH